MAIDHKYGNLGSGGENSKHDGNFFKFLSFHFLNAILFLTYEFMINGLILLC